MNAALVLFLRLIVRPLRNEPIRAALTCFAVALGVAVIVAIDLAGKSAASSFHSSLETLAGKNDLAITATAGVDELVLGQLAQLPYPFELTPRIEDFATVDGRGAAIPFFGLDLVGMTNQTALPSALQWKQPQQSPDADAIPLWVTTGLRLPVGKHIRLLINSQLQEFVIAGNLPAQKYGGDQQDLFITDIGYAQIATGKAGKLDRIYVKTPANGSLSHWRAVLSARLPAGTIVSPQGAATDQNRKMLSAFRWNLRALSYVAVLVGGFLIYNTISISVVRRRADIGVVRALGGTRAELLWAFLLEALLFAGIGGGFGVLLGRVMAVGAASLVGSTVESLYVTNVPAPVHLSLGSVANGVAIGVGVSLLAALAPASEAARVSPIEAVARGRWEFVNTQRSRWLWRFALGLLVLSAVFTKTPPVMGAPAFGYAAVLLLVMGTSLLIPNIISWSAAGFTAFLQRLLGVEAVLAMQSLRSSLGRTAVLTAALATAVAMAAAVGIMVGSFRETVEVWLNSELTADFYLRPPGSAAADRHPTMSAAIADALERIPGVAAVDRFRAYPITYEGLPATFAGGEAAKPKGRGAIRFLPGENTAEILSKLNTGDYAVVSEPFANKHNVRPGSELRLPLGGAIRRFQVLGVYYDYSTERGFIVVDRSTLLKYLPDPAASNVAVYLEPHADASAVRRSINQALGGQSVLVFSNGSLRRGAITLFDQTFRITYALELVAVIVAVLGIAGALLALVIDRRREFALLRFLGASQPQIRRIILCEAGLLGLLANGIGIVLGTLLSLILIFVINKQSFGWTIQFHWPVALVLAMLGGIYIATLLAGLYPARIAARLDPIEAIHEE
ncbi:MAG TPA: FtsX-like permease family protein [Bryobacteraceae bacterium]|jgi:putative ABC transport system permease protein|nr:FtsX-like permease family protein [Bryobacteraceae bacterium]